MGPASPGRGGSRLPAPTDGGLEDPVEGLEWWGLLGWAGRIVRSHLP